MHLRICNNCVMDTTDHGIQFNAQGICNYCITFAKNENKRRVDKLQRPWLIDNLKKAGKNKQYDCIIGLSGGVDSSLCLHYLRESGLRPFAFTVDNGWNSAEADENIMRIVEYSPYPVRFFRKILDKKEFSDLQISFVRAGVKNIEIPTDHILRAVAYQMAIEYDCSYIISGGNYATESVMPTDWGYEPQDLKHIKAIFKKFMGRKLRALPTMSLAQYIFYRFFKKIQVINLLDFYDYNRENAKKELEKIYGWKDYGDKHCESIFTWWFQSWYLPIKWNIDKRKAHYSSLILSNQMTRTEALKKLLEPLIYPKLGIEKKVLQYQKHEYSDYATNEKLWNFLSGIYGIFKRFSNFGERSF